MGMPWSDVLTRTDWVQNTTLTRILRAFRAHFTYSGLRSSLALLIEFGAESSLVLSDAPLRSNKTLAQSRRFTVGRVRTACLSWCGV